MSSNQRRPPTPNWRGAGTDCFWCRSRRHPHSFLSALYLLNQWVDFDQTCTDTLLGGGKKWLDFGDLDLIFKVTPAHWNFQMLTQNLRLSAPYLLHQMTNSGQTSYIVTLRWFKDLIGFWWTWPNFQGHHTIKIVKMSLVCILSPEPIGGFWPNLHWDMGKKWLDFGDLDLIFKVTPTLWMSNLDQKSLSAPYHFNQMMGSDQTLCIENIELRQKFKCIQ